MDAYSVNDQMQPILNGMTKGNLIWYNGFTEDSKLIELHKAYSLAYDNWATGGLTAEAAAAFVTAAGQLKNYIELNYSLIDGAYVKKSALPAGTGSTPEGNNIMVLIGVVAAVAILSFIFKKK